MVDRSVAPPLVDAPSTEGSSADPPQYNTSESSAVETTLARRMRLLYGEPTCWGMMPMTHPLRAFCIALVESPWFGRLFVGLILANCVILVLSTYPTYRLSFDGVDNYFIYAFTIEMIAKMCAKGVWTGARAYLHDPWNCFDAVLVVLGWISFAPTVGNFTFIRSLRILRPLRSLNALPGLRLMMAAMLRTLPNLGNVGILLLTVLLVFSVVGLQFFLGQTNYRCVSLASSLVASASEINSGPLCNSDLYSTPSVTAGRKCPKDYYCGYINQVTEYGITSFDSFLSSFLTTLVMISGEGWSNTMYYMQDATNKWSNLYFISLMTLASFFLIQLVREGQSGCVDLRRSV
jgi:hypothetical protein